MAEKILRSLLKAESQFITLRKFTALEIFDLNSKGKIPQNLILWHFFVFCLFYHEVKIAFCHVCCWFALLALHLNCRMSFYCLKIQTLLRQSLWWHFLVIPKNDLLSSKKRSCNELFSSPAQFIVPLQKRLRAWQSWLRLKMGGSPPDWIGSDNCASLKSTQRLIFLCQKTRGFTVNPKITQLEWQIVRKILKNMLHFCARKT